MCGPSSEKAFAMLQVYMDDSGSHNGSHNCVVAGYWGSVLHWAALEREWKQILAIYGIEEFKSNKFWRKSSNNRVPPYTGWSDAKASVFFESLLSVLADHSLYPFAAGVLGEEWKLQPPNTKFLASGTGEERLQKALFMPLHRSIYRCLSYCPVGETMHFVFDESSDKRLKLLMLACFDRVKRHLHEAGDELACRMGALSFEDSKNAVQLQAADALAYLAHRYAKALTGDTQLAPSDEYALALSRMRSKEDFWLYDSPRFAVLASILDQVGSESLNGRSE